MQQINYMKITLISLDVLGINDEIIRSLKRQGFTDVNHINFNDFKYKYPTVFHRVFNFISKTFFMYDIKKEHLNREILLRLKKLGQQDKILMINANFLLPHIVKNIRFYAKEFVSFFNDNTKRIPKILKVAPFFDQVYTFEPNDASKYGFKFVTNYIFKENHEQQENYYQVFNISTFSNRSKLIDNIALKLDSLNVTYKIFSYGKKKIKSTSKIQYIRERKDMVQVNELVSKSNVLLDIHREGQNGLSFRVFESLGNRKKLITTNKDIVNYDFYNPNNILVIDKDNLDIPLSFFQHKYEDLPYKIYNKYTIDSWVRAILNI